MKRIILVFLTISFSLAGISACRYFETELTPTEVLRSHYEAELKKDIAVLTENLSKDSLKMLKKSALKINLDETYLIENSLGFSKRGFPEIRNEKIEGNIADIELKNDLTGEWDKMPFVKEEGKWKIDLKEFIGDTVEEFNNNRSKF